MRLAERARILLVDDEQEIRDVVGQLLTQWGYEVDTVLSGEDALELLAQRTYDVLIVDVVLVTMSGLDVMVEAKRRDPRIEAIVLTGFGPAERAREAVQKGASAYLQKPISARVLRARVAEAASKRQFSQLTEEAAAQINAEDRPFEEHLRQLKGLYDFGRKLNRTDDYEEVVDAILRGILDLASGTYGCIFILEESAARLYVHTDPLLSETSVRSLKERVIEFWEGMGEEVPRERIEVVHRWPDSTEEEPAHDEAVDPLLVPLATENKIVGVLGAGDIGEGQDLEERLLYVLSGHAAAALMRASMHHHTQILATTDPLTGLYNRRAFLDRLRQEVDRGVRYGSSLSLIIGDSDTLKQINDMYGHQDGDMFIRQIADLLRKRLRDTDIISRYGGDEFAIILPQTRLSDAVLVAEQLRTSVEKHTFCLKKASVSSTISMGIASFPEPEGRTKGRPPTREDIARWTEELFEQADLAMYRAKELGKNRVYAGE